MEPYLVKGENQRKRPNRTGKDLSFGEQKIFPRLLLAGWSICTTVCVAGKSIRIITAFFIDVPKVLQKNRKLREKAKATDHKRYITITKFFNAGVTAIEAYSTLNLDAHCSRS